ncbi:hypothetical protein ACIA5G_06160 [Amycolatopsis sp. NPDC051758]|uniref:hypothetical protein n=1 Tax=Amycolatopsis sp. NPDC051758 TaxID=3363935 RepID=UPI0037BC8737
MPEQEATQPAAEPALLGLTVRDAILAATELNSDVPIARSPAAEKSPAAEPVPDDGPGHRQSGAAAGREGRDG